jgi:hypothetical protein
MATIILGRTQTADATPFDPNRVTALWPSGSGIAATDVQNAIEEAKNDALNNDRYPIQASYGGNANAGRYLEIYAGLDSSSTVAPMVAPEKSNIVAYSFGCTASSTGVIKVRNHTTAIDILTVTFTAQTRITVTGTVIAGINALDELGIYVSSGSLNKPFCRIWFNTVT